MKLIKFLCLALVVAVFFSCQNKDGKTIDLSGKWQFKTDSLDQGVHQKWFEDTLSENIDLPGSMATNGLGNNITVNTKWTGSMWNDSLWYKSPKYKKYRQSGNVKVSFWLTPKKKYTGPAWYQKKVTVPKSWKKQHISLNLERCHWETILWVDDNKIGMENTLGTPHHYKLDEYLTPGEHMLTIRVDNRVKAINPGVDAHSISDNTQTNWNGIVGDISLKAAPKLYIDAVKLYPNVAKKEVRVKVSLKNATGKAQKVDLSLLANSTNKKASDLDKLQKQYKIKNDSTVMLRYPMGDKFLRWDEFHPNLYTMLLKLDSNLGEDKKESTFGMRNFKAEGKQFTINGRPLFLRGTLECALFPKTGYPPTDLASWKKILHKIKSYGLNHLRFHSWCPPEAAFKAADELGVYYQIEASAWTRVGNGKPIDKWIYKEAKAIVDTYGNHPSFVMMVYGNEPAGKNRKAYLKKFVTYMKKYDPRKLYTSGSGWPYLDNMDYYVNAKPRIQHWAEGLKSIINAKPPQTEFDYSKLIQKTPMPYVSHEMGQWCVYPNFDEMSKYTGVLQPKNFEIFKETLKEHHMADLADSLKLASGKLQVLCYKADIEAALRTKDMAGFQLLGLHDFTGQGTALVGVLDAFWENKGYVTGEEFSQFCSPTVPLARLPKRVLFNTDTLKASVEVAHFGEKPLKEVVPSWELTGKGGAVFAQGKLPAKTIPIGNGIQLGKINVNLEKAKKATELKLTVHVGENKNSWDVWVYPSKKEPIAHKTDFRVVEKLDGNTMNYLKKGGKVLLNISKGAIASGKGGDIGIGFSSIFWNTSWTNGQKPHTLGILCDPDHPALVDFPTEYHSNWQWWDAMSHSNAIILDGFSTKLKPIVRVIDDWFDNHRTALIFEAKVGKGKLLFSGVDLHSDLKNRPEAQQLLYSLKKYVASKNFDPKVEIDPGKIMGLLKQ